MPHFHPDSNYFSNLNLGINCANVKSGTISGKPKGRGVSMMIILKTYDEIYNMYQTDTALTPKAKPIPYQNQKKNNNLPSNLYKELSRPYKRDYSQVYRDEVLTNPKLRVLNIEN